MQHDEIAPPMLWDDAADLMLEEQLAELTENTLLPARQAASPAPPELPGVEGPSALFVGFALTASAAALVASAVAILVFTTVGIVVTAPDAPETVSVVVVE